MWLACHVAFPHCHVGWFAPNVSHYPLTSYKQQLTLPGIFASRFTLIHISSLCFTCCLSFPSVCCVWLFTLVVRYCCVGCCRLSSVVRLDCWPDSFGLVASCCFSCHFGFVTMFVSMMLFIAQFCPLLGFCELLTFHRSDCNARWLAKFALIVLTCFIVDLIFCA